MTLIDQSDLVVVGTVVSPDAKSDGGDVLDIVVESVLHGTLDTKRVRTTVYYPFADGDVAPSFLKGQRSIFFLQCNPSGSWNAVDWWFGVQPFNKRMAGSIQGYSALQRLISETMSAKFDPGELTDVEKKLESIVIPEMSFRGACTGDALLWLAESSVKHDPKRTGVVFEFDRRALPQGHVDMTVPNISCLRFLRIVVATQGLKYETKDGKVIVTTRRGEQPEASDSNDQVDDDPDPFR